jgi:hypothetical protein
MAEERFDGTIPKPADEVRPTRGARTLGASKPGRLLLVRHGWGLGWENGRLQHLLDHLKRTAPALFARIVVHETGTTEPPPLDDVAAVVFQLAEPPDHYPACFREARAIAAAARDRGIAVIDPPEAYDRGAKSVQAARLAAAGVPTPPCCAFASRAELEAALDAAAFPVVIRADLLHRQARTAICADRARALAFVDDRFPLPGALSPFVDTRAIWRARAPGTVWGRLHHKKRAYVFGDAVVPCNLYFSKSPIVTSTTSTFYGGGKGWAARKGARLAARALPLRQAALSLDVGYAAAPPEHAEILRRAARALELDFSAIDYSILGDGRPVVWEVNSHFLFIPWRDDLLPKERGLETRNERVMGAMGAYFEGLIGAR